MSFSRVKAYLTVLHIKKRCNDILMLTSSTLAHKTKSNYVNIPLLMRRTIRWKTFTVNIALSVHLKKEFRELEKSS